MNSEELIEKALTGNFKHAEIYKMLVDSVSERGENYYESPYWRNHEEKVRNEIAKLRELRRIKFAENKLDAEYSSAKTKIKALEGLIL